MTYRKFIDREKMLLSFKFMFSELRSLISLGFSQGMHIRGFLSSASSPFLLLRGLEMQLMVGNLTNNFSCLIIFARPLFASLYTKSLNHIYGDVVFID